jgi:hypothetical protein
MREIVKALSQRVVEIAEGDFAHPRKVRMGVDCGGDVIVSHVRAPDGSLAPRPDAAIAARPVLKPRLIAASYRDHGFLSCLVFASHRPLKLFPQCHAATLVLKTSKLMH